MHPNTPPRPTSSPPRPAARDDLTHATSSQRPHPYGDEVALRRRRRAHKNTTPARPRDEVRDEVNDLMGVGRG